MDPYYLFVGGSDGKVHQVNLNTPGVAGTVTRSLNIDTTGCPSSCKVGDVSTNAARDVIFVGHENGKIYKINLADDPLGVCGSKCALP
jgi:hypothetical protein